MVCLLILLLPSSRPAATACSIPTQAGLSACTFSETLGQRLSSRVGTTAAQCCVASGRPQDCWQHQPRYWLARPGISPGMTFQQRHRAVEISENHTALIAAQTAPGNLLLLYQGTTTFQCSGAFREHTTPAIGEAQRSCVPWPLALHLPLQASVLLWVREPAWQRAAILGDPHGDEKGDLRMGGNGWNMLGAEPALGMCIVASCIANAAWCT